MTNGNVTILLIGQTKLLKNKFIEAINDKNNIFHFTLMTKTIESLKSLSERIDVPCFICDYVLPQETELNKSLRLIDFKKIWKNYDFPFNFKLILSNVPPETTYVQLVDASDRNLINNLISRSINKEMNKNFHFNVNAIIYLYDEFSPASFAYVQSVHLELNKTFQDFVTNNENLKLLLFNMKNATIPSNESSIEGAVNFSQIEKFLDKFTNIQYIVQEFMDTILGSKPKRGGSDSDNSIKSSLDEIMLKFHSIYQDLSFPGKRKEKESDLSYRIGTLSDSIKSVDEVKEVSSDRNKVTVKKTYQGEMQNNLRNGNIFVDIFMSFGFKIFLKFNVFS